MEKVFQIFKAGTHTAMNGAALHYFIHDLQRIAQFYPSGKLAPLVLGHPKDDRPVYGHVKRMFVKGDGLYTHCDVSDGLVNAVREGRYKNISAAFWNHNHPDNPAPGGWSLKHVGFLGAWPPAVKGMDALAFADQAGVTCFSAGPCDLGQCVMTLELDFMVPRGYRIDPADMQTYGLIQEYRRGCPELSFAEAARLATNIYTHPVL